MRALFTTGIKSNPIDWRDVPAPLIHASTDALVKPIAVAACDLDRSIVNGHSPFPGEFMLGHEFTAEIIDLGEEVVGLSPGDTVIVSFQPSCGICTRCGQGYSSVCRTVPNGSMYGIGKTGGDWSGAITDLVRVPWASFNLLKIPKGIDPVSIASGSDNLADGLRGVDGPLQRRPGASVLITGSGSIPLYAVVCARHLGAESITLASKDPFALAVGERLGVQCLPVDVWPKHFRSHDITIDCTNDVQGLAAVIASTAPYGECTSSSIFFGESIPVPMFNMNMKGIHFHTGRVNSASQLTRILDLVGNGLDPELIQPAHHLMSDAIDALLSEPFSRKVILTHA